MPTPPAPPDALRARFRRRRALAGLRVLLTGGSSGVGRALAVELSARGAAVFATARRAPLLATLALWAVAGLFTFFAVAVGLLSGNAAKLYSLPI